MTVNTLGSNEQDRSSRTVAEWLWPFLPMGISAFSLSALIWYHLRRDVFERDIHSALQVMYANLYKLIGFAPSVLFFLLTLTWSSIWFATGKVDRPLGRLGRLLAMTVMIGILINLGHGGVAPEVHKGELGAWLAEHLYNSFGYLPSLLVVWAVTFASMLLATDFFFSDSFERLRTARPAAPTESGVETAVTDHLRGLGAAPAPLVVPTLPIAAEAPAPAIGTDLLAAAAAAASAISTPVEGEAGNGQPPTEEPPPEPRRRSYAERRRDRERRWEQEEWVPPAPENQEIENPEASLRTAGPTEAAAAVDAAEVAPQASMAAPATVGETPVLDGETDLVDIEELEDFVGGEEEESVDDDEDDADEVDADAVDGERDDSTAPVEIERPTVVATVEAVEPVEPVDAVEAPTPVAEPMAVAPAAAGVEAFASDDRAAAVDADEDADAEDLDEEGPVDGARDDDEDDDDDVRQFDEIEDVDEVEDDLEVVAEAGTGVAGAPQPAPGDEPVVSIPRPDPSGGWSPVIWQPQRQPEQPAAQAAEPPVEIPSREPEPVERREAPREAEVPSAREATDERAAGRQQQLFGSWLDEALIQDAIEVVTSTRRANAALLQRKLRIDYALAVDVLGALAARGVVELEGDSTQGRVLV
ncbi:MAG: hypothetical protein MUC36_16740 [Planctomycetes bacterium]|jgi:hypothetical protein|nr:hypothetical protein [Planctomycetota bacterium]